MHHVLSVYEMGGLLEKAQQIRHVVRPIVEHIVGLLPPDKVDHSLGPIDLGVDRAGRHHVRDEPLQVGLLEVQQLRKARRRDALVVLRHDANVVLHDPGVQILPEGFRGLGGSLEHVQLGKVRLVELEQPRPPDELDGDKVFDKGLVPGKLGELLVRVDAVDEIRLLIVVGRQHAIDDHERQVVSPPGLVLRHDGRVVDRPVRTCDVQVFLDLIKLIKSLMALVQTMTIQLEWSKEWITHTHTHNTQQWADEGI